MSENDMMIFFMSGIILIMFVNIALWSPINSVNNDLYNGTLEYVYSTPASRFGYYVGYGLADLIIRSVFVVPVLITLIVLSDSGLINTLNILGVILIIGLMVVSMGVLVGLTAIVWKQTSAIAGILGTMFQFVAGAYFPIQSLPVAVQYVAMVLPFTYGYDLIRYYAFHGDWEPILPIPIMWLILLANAVIYYLVALKMLQKVEKKAKRQGLHLL
jgi:ABC-2 type transport system permease protein